MPSHKQKVSKQLWNRVRGFLDVPSAQDDKAEYMAARRKVEKLVENPVFVAEAKRQFKSFGDFLVNYNLNVADFDRFLNMDMNEFIKQHKK